MSRKKVLLALDLSTKTGWALGSLAGEPCRFGTWVLPSFSPDPAATGAALMEALSGAIAVHNPDRVVAEAPLPAMRQKSQDIAVGLMGLAFCARLFCFWRSIPYAERTPGDGRRAFTGTFYAQKHQIIGWCRSRGYDVVDDNAADALLLLHYTLAPALSAWPKKTLLKAAG